MDTFAVEVQRAVDGHHQVIIDAVNLLENTGLIKSIEDRIERRTKLLGGNGIQCRANMIIRRIIGNAEDRCRIVGAPLAPNRSQKIKNAGHCRKNSENALMAMSAMVQRVFMPVRASERSPTMVRITAAS